MNQKAQLPTTAAWEPISPRLLPTSQRPTKPAWPITERRSLMSMVMLTGNIPSPKAGSLSLGSLWAVIWANGALRGGTCRGARRDRPR